MLGQRKYLLRWRYDYAGGTSRAGMWSRPGNNEATQAWRHNKEGLVRAAIEGKDIESNQVVTLAECRGHEFRTFQWMAVSRVPFGLRGTATPVSQLVGLKILTSDHEIVVGEDGDVGRNLLSESEKGVNFATYGK